MADPGAPRPAGSGRFESSPAGLALVADLASGFGRAVRAAGIPCSPERSVRFARALELVPPESRERLYWTARATFVSSHGDVERFDRVFAQVFEAVTDPADSRGDSSQTLERDVVERGERAAPSGRRQPVTGAGGDSSSTPTAEGETGEDDDREVPGIPLAAAHERLGTKDFAELEPHELLLLRRLMADLRVATPPRRTRRARRARHGARLDVRATLRAAHRTGGDPVRRVRRERRSEPRPLVALCDVSGSMEPYARAFLLFLQSAVGAADAEAFVFATRLTRLTRALRDNRPERALAHAATLAPDWSGGTRIGEALRRFNDLHGRRGMARGAVVVIVSDGWETGDPALVGREMERLARLAHRIVWINPRAAAPGFRPEAGGMAAALPSCDALVSGHNLKALTEAVEAIGTK